MNSWLLSKSESRLLKTLMKHCVGYKVRGDEIKILYEPSDFYSELHRRSSKAESRIVLGTLYWGTGNRERELIDSIRFNPYRPRVKILLDYCRGSRTDNSSSSLKLMKPLAAERSEIYFYHTPRLRGIWKRILPPRINEVVGLQHVKIYVFDDSVLISGANLSRDYFERRQDRYLLIENAGDLADFFETLVDVIGRYSFRLETEGLKWRNQLCLPYEEDIDRFSEALRRDLEELLSKESTKSESKFESYDTIIFPSIQLGHVGVTNDSELMTDLLKVPGIFDFGTGYFNLTSEYRRILLKESGTSRFRILTAHPKANGFYGSKGLSGGIPAAYTWILSQFHSSVLTNRDENRIRLFEYNRPQWTFHGKGLWYSSFDSSTSYPIFTTIGSPNFGSRSVERDIEASLSVFTVNESLRRSLFEESQRLFQSSIPVTRSELDDRKVPLWVRFVVRMARHLF